KETVVLIECFGDRTKFAKPSGNRHVLPVNVFARGSFDKGFSRGSLDAKGVITSERHLASPSTLQCPLSECDRGKNLPLITRCLGCGDDVVRKRRAWLRICRWRRTRECSKCRAIGIHSTVGRI